MSYTLTPALPTPQSTAAAEAMTMCYSLKNQKKPMFFVDENCHPQNIALATTRGEALGMEIKVGATSSLDLSNGKYCGVMVGYDKTVRPKFPFNITHK